MNRNDIQHYLDHKLTLIPLKARDKKPLVKWGNGWNPTAQELEQWLNRPNINIGIRTGASLGAFDLDSEEKYRNFIATHLLPETCPVIKTGRGYHIWFKPKKAIPSQLFDGIEIKYRSTPVQQPVCLPAIIKLSLSMTHRPIQTSSRYLPCWVGLATP